MPTPSSAANERVGAAIGGTLMETPFVPCSGERVPPAVKVALPWASRCAYRASCPSVPQGPASLPGCNLHMKAS